MPPMSQSIRLALLQKALEQRRAYQQSLFSLHTALADESGAKYEAYVTDPGSVTAPTVQLQVIKAYVENALDKFEDFADVDKFALSELAHMHAMAAPN